MVEFHEYRKPTIAFNIHCIFILIIIFFLKKYLDQINLYIFIICSFLLFCCFLVEVFIIYKKQRISKFFIVTAITQILTQTYFIYYLEKKYNTNIISYNLIYLTFSVFLQLICLKNSTKSSLIYLSIDIVCFVIFVLLLKFNIIEIIISFLYLFIFSTTSMLFLSHILNRDGITNFLNYLLISSFEYFSIFFILIMIFKYCNRNVEAGEDLFY